MASSQSDSRVRLVDCEKSSSTTSTAKKPSSSSVKSPPSQCDVRTERSRVSVIAAWTVCGLACLLTAWTAVLYWTQLSHLRADLDSLRHDFQDVNQLTADHIDAAIQQVDLLFTRHAYIGLRTCIHKMHMHWYIVWVEKTCHYTFTHNVYQCGPIITFVSKISMTILQYIFKIWHDIRCTFNGQDDRKFENRPNMSKLWANT